MHRRKGLCVHLYMSSHLKGLMEMRMAFCPTLVYTAEFPWRFRSVFSMFGVFTQGGSDNNNQNISNTNDEAPRTFHDQLPSKFRPYELAEIVLGVIPTVVNKVVSQEPPTGRELRFAPLWNSINSCASRIPTSPLWTVVLESA